MGQGARQSVIQCAPQRGGSQCVAFFIVLPTALAATRPRLPTTECARAIPDTLPHVTHTRCWVGPPERASVERRSRAVVASEAIIGHDVPLGCAGEPLPTIGADPRIVVERPHADSHDVAGIV